MVTSVISAGDAANLGVQTTGGNDGVLVLRSGAAGAKVDAVSIAASGTATFDMTSNFVKRYATIISCSQDGQLTVAY